MGKNIVVVGSSNTDMVIKTDRIPKPGETVIGGTFLTAAGGKGANQAVAAARAGGDVTFIARVGTDHFGDQALQGLREANVDVSNVLRTSDQPSGVALIFVDKQGENSIAVASGANEQLNPTDIDAVTDVLTGADILVMQLETPLDTIRRAATIASKANVQVLLNPAPAQRLTDDLLGNLSILTPNESEVELLTGIGIQRETDARQAAEFLQRKGVKTVLITLGPRGVYVAGDGKHELLPSFSVKAVDSTAAGDAFSGALAVALAEGTALQEAVRFASAAGALSVTRFGAQPSAPAREEIAAFLQRQN